MQALQAQAAEFYSATATPMQVLISQPRGLMNFIKEIRDSKSKEEERSRVDKELANIRHKFATSSNLTSYQKKKYVWKMCYIFMLGYEVDFGHVEFISLLSSTKFQEKSVGYMAVSLLLKPGDELMTLVINSIRNDMIGPLHFGQTLALSAVANIGGDDLGEALSTDLQKMISTPLEEGQINYNFGPDGEAIMAQKANVLKKATLCLLTLFRNNPECVEIEEWNQRLAKLLEDRDLGPS
jgi:AP-2 complex subunit alpha